MTNMWNIVESCGIKFFTVLTLCNSLDFGPGCQLILLNSYSDPGCGHAKSQAQWGNQETSFTLWQPPSRMGDRTTPVKTC